MRKTLEAVAPDEAKMIRESMKQDLNQLAYKSMNSFTYYSVTFALFIVEVIMAILIKDISVVFSFIGTIAGTSLSFFIPSAFFMRAMTLYADDDMRE